MLADSYIVPQCEARPRSLGGLMTLYEGNFIKLLALAPFLAGSDAGRPCAARPAGLAGRRWVSTTPSDLDLHLAVHGVSRYTVDLRLTYLFAESAGLMAREPDLEVRLYLDARMAEAMNWAISHHHPALRELAAGAGRELDRRWGRNIMLGKWLDYLAERGHRLRVA